LPWPILARTRTGRTLSDFQTDPLPRIVDHGTVHAEVSLLIVLLVVALIVAGPTIEPWIFGRRGPFSD